MFTKSFAAFLFSLTCCLANAEYKTFEIDKPLKCGSASQLLEFLENSYNEKQVWIGIDLSMPNESYVALLKNPDNGKWTLVQYNSHVACILGSGIKNTPAPQGEQK
jgi:hypothetical protein